MLVSAIYQHKLAIPILESPSHFPPHPTPLGCHRELDLSCVCHKANSHYFTYGNIYISKLFSQFCHPLLPSVSTICSLCLHLPCCAANRFISIILSRLHIYALIYICLSNLLHYFTLYNKLYYYNMLYNEAPSH